MIQKPEKKKEKGIKFFVLDSISLYYFCCCLFYFFFLFSLLFFVSFRLTLVHNAMNVNEWNSFRVKTIHLFVLLLVIWIESLLIKRFWLIFTRIYCYFTLRYSWLRAKKTNRIEKWKSTDLTKRRINNKYGDWSVSLQRGNLFFLQFNCMYIVYEYINRPIPMQIQFDQCICAQLSVWPGTCITFECERIRVRSMNDS